MERRLWHAGSEQRVAWRSSAGAAQHQVNGQPIEAVVRPGPDRSLLIRFGAVTYRALVDVQADHTDVCVDGHHYRFQHQPPERGTRGGSGAEASGGRLISPMTGRVRRVLTSEGQLVQAGESLVLVEAMKMEFPIRATGAGRVARLHVAEGDPIEMGGPLVDLELDPA